MQKKINIRIFPDGKVQAEVEGIKGKSCTDYIKLIEELLEAETFDSEYTSEFYETEEVILDVKQEQKVGRGFNKQGE